jgi:uncharacterized cupredoxin-like copper-binding protein
LGSFACGAMKRLLILAPIAALAVAGCGGSTTKNASASKPTAAARSAIERDAVTLDEFGINPATTKLKPGKVEFDVKNTGKVSHEFVVIQTTKNAADLGHGHRASEKGNIGETGNVKPGASKTLVLNLRKGHYAVICNDPGHYMAGMHKDLEVS